MAPPNSPASSAQTPSAASRLSGSLAAPNPDLKTRANVLSLDLDRLRIEAQRLLDDLDNCADEALAIHEELSHAAG